MCKLVEEINMTELRVSEMTIMTSNMEIIKWIILVNYYENTDAVYDDHCNNGGNIVMIMLINMRRI